MSKSETSERECVWRYDGDGYFDSACGHATSWEGGDLQTDYVTFCMYCGGKIALLAKHTQEVGP